MDSFGVSGELVSAIGAVQLELRGQFHDSLKVAVRLGHLLQRAKGECRHGDFECWLKQHFEGSVRHAQRFMQLAAKYPSEAELPTLSLREALRMIAGRQPAEIAVSANERLSHETLEKVLFAVGRLSRAHARRVVSSLEIDGLTKRHAAMKHAKQIESSLRKFIEYLQAEDAIARSERASLSVYHPEDAGNRV